MDLINATTAVKNETFLHCQSTQNLGTFFLCIVMMMEMVVGLPLTILALWIFCFRMKSWKPHAVFLFNLVLADFLLLISVPLRIDNELRGSQWVFGKVWCHINLFMLAANRSASIAFMTVVALDRYFKVVHPHHWISRMTLIQAVWLAGLIWILVIALRIPLVTNYYTGLFYQNGNVSLCRSFNSYNVIPLPVKMHYAAFTAEFFLPWFLLLFCSARIACYLHKRGMDRQKRVQRAIRAVGVISLVFTICFFPSIFTGFGGMYIKYFHPKDCISYNLMTQLFRMSIGFTYLNSALDPFIYSYSSSMFHDALRSYLSFVRKNVTPAKYTVNNC